MPLLRSKLVFDLSFSEKGLTMSRRFVKALAAILLCNSVAGDASAQMYIGYLAPGSTVEGDFMRGSGVMLNGAGLYNYYSAMGNAINVNTMINLNEYIYQSLKNENHEKAMFRAAVAAKRRENYEKILDRVQHNPNELDVNKGDALNALREALADPKISKSEISLNSVPISAEMVRSIPFFYASKDAVISLRRLSLRGKWPIGLRGKALANERKAYERALDTAMEQQFDGKLSKEAIAKVEAAVLALEERLEMEPLDPKDRLYIDAKSELRKLLATKELLKIREVEHIIGEINKYSGTTVAELLVFMQRNNLRFHIPEIGDEREIYPKIYAAFKQQLDGTSYQK